LQVPETSNGQQLIKIKKHTVIRGTNVKLRPLNGFMPSPAPITAPPQGSPGLPQLIVLKDNTLEVRSDAGLSSGVAGFKRGPSHPCCDLHSFSSLSSCSSCDYVQERQRTAIKAVLESVLETHMIEVNQQLVLLQQQQQQAARMTRKVGVPHAQSAVTFI
jgi:hypothetical protein